MTSNIRRVPRQARSRARVESILSCAVEMIESQGSGLLKMNDLAAQAAIPIGSLYQYFPDRAAIVHTLAERLMLRVHEEVKKEFDDILTVADFEIALKCSINNYYSLFLKEPVSRDVWSAFQANQDSHLIDIADSRKNAKVLFSAIRHLCVPGARTALKTSLFLSMQLCGAAVRMAISVKPTEGDRIIATCTGMIRREVLLHLRQD